MVTSISSHSGQRTTTRVAIPKTRDPFVNTPLLPVKRDAHGVTWYWISSYNGVNGCIGVLISEFSDYRIYRFPPRLPGFYSMVVEDDDTLWLCGSLDRVVRLTLSTGAFEEYPTGAPHALVFQGMAYDRETGKLFAAAFPYTTTTAFSFDTRARVGVKVYEHICVERYMRASFPNGDGSYSIALEVPGNSLLRWDPRAETLEPTGIQACPKRLIADERGRYYFPEHGWYDPRTHTMAPDGPRPEREMSWLTRVGQMAYGATSDGVIATVNRWNFATGNVTACASLPDVHAEVLQITPDEKILAVNTYGVFFRIDAATGAVEISKSLPTTAIGAVDCIRRIDQDRLLGTPFITQRFWEVDLRTGTGYDCGRAAPGSGEVLKTWQIGGTIYLAAYGGGELVAYDPSQHPHFPENPRVVADPPGGMRPVAAASHGHLLYYSCSAEYGHLGSVLTRYDTRTGLASYAANPLHDQQICSLVYDKATKSLLGSTTIRADCQSCPPTADRALIARLSPDTLAVEQTFALPEGVVHCDIRGALGGGRWLCLCEPGTKWFILDAATFTAPGVDDLHDLPPIGMQRITPTSKPGKFVIQVGHRLERWDLRRWKREEVLVPQYDGYNFAVQGDALYVFRRREIIVIDGIS